MANSPRKQISAMLGEYGEVFGKEMFTNYLWKESPMLALCNMGKTSRQRGLRFAIFQTHERGC